MVPRVVWLLTLRRVCRIRRHESNAHAITFWWCDTMLFRIYRVIYLFSQVCYSGTMAFPVFSIYLPVLSNLDFCKLALPDAVPHLLECACARAQNRPTRVKRWPKALSGKGEGHI